MSDAKYINYKELLQPLRAALYDYDAEEIKTALSNLCVEEVIVNFPFPFETSKGYSTLLEGIYDPLQKAIPDVERRETIVICGSTEEGNVWVGCCGYYTGSFMQSWLDIPPTGHQVGMRFHEFFRIENDKIIEIQALWDIPSLMMQANAWPMSPSLGREWQVPSPASQDGIIKEIQSESKSVESRELIVDMLNDMIKHPKQGGPEVMNLDKYWHPKVSWYGPAGIGTCRGIEGFRHWHQIPFLKSMPDRGQDDNKIDAHFFAEGNYAAVTGWPVMRQSITHDGWLGIPPTGKKIHIRSLDFWRIENGLIRENWVLVDLLSIYHQLGVDVLGRLREFNKARNMSPINTLNSNAMI